MELSCHLLLDSAFEHVDFQLFAQMLVMPTINPLRTFVDKVNQYPSWLSSKLMMWVFRYKVKLAGT
jgi:uncharacterized membrane protein YqhA